ncbi:hypothetical protein ONZ45_g15880 [Pleurotus djamor]|nr:hypothetical protein ONZ45_g15880 [Pleurotus djamor]
MLKQESRLPYELLLRVVELIEAEEQSTFYNLLISCRTLSAIVEPRLYHDAAFIERSGTVSPLAERMEAFYTQISKDNARLATFVRGLTFASDPSNSTSHDVSVIIEILPLLINLEYFRLSYHDRKIPSISILQSFRSPKLQTFIWESISLGDNPYFAEFVGLNPSIRHLEAPHTHSVDSLSSTSLPHLTKLAANIRVTWSLLPTRPITHLHLVTPFPSFLLDPVASKVFSVITHFYASTGFNASVGMTLDEFLHLFSPSLTLKKLEYFSVYSDSPLHSKANVIPDLFRSIPSLRVFDLTHGHSSNFTRYRYDGHSNVMPLPMFKGTWPSERELFRILHRSV